MLHICFLYWLKNGKLISFIALGNLEILLSLIDVSLLKWAGRDLNLYIQSQVLIMEFKGCVVLI